MSVVRTDKWLLDSWDNPIKFCTQLENYFSGVSATEIYHYLVMHGMYQHPLNDGKSLIKKLQKVDRWNLIREEEQRLKKLWNGPDVPVFIFPANLNNDLLRNEFNGKSGLAFVDKLFLFISEVNSDNELKALFTHEYNHVCRLTAIGKEEKDFTLLDTIILEGLAEHAVLEQWGPEYSAKWTLHYSDAELEKLWKNLILPASDLPKQHPKHRSILYGTHFYPEMAGYSVGYYLVKKYVKKNNRASKELLHIPASKIAQTDIKR